MITSVEPSSFFIVRKKLLSFLTLCYTLCADRRTFIVPESKSSNRVRQCCSLQETLRQRLSTSQIPSNCISPHFVHTSAQHNECCPVHHQKQRFIKSHKMTSCNTRCLIGTKRTFNRHSTSLCKKTQFQHYHHTVCSYTMHT